MPQIRNWALAISRRQEAGVACITDLMVKEGLINLDFADVRAVMREMGKAMMGTGEAEGEDGERKGNLEQKQKLLTEIEALLQESRPDWFKDEAKAIQAKWREIGQVPRENMDINERFRAACDAAAPVGIDVG